MERLWKLGLLTPAFNAVHMTHATAADIELAQRTGIVDQPLPTIAVCQSGRPAAGRAPSSRRAFARVGSGGRRGACSQNRCVGRDEIARALTSTAAASAHTPGMFSRWPPAAAPPPRAGRRSGHARSRQMGGSMLHRSSAARPRNPCAIPSTQLVLSGGRDIVSDVWVAGRQLLSEGELTRLDWPGVADRARPGPRA